MSNSQLTQPLATPNYHRLQGKMLVNSIYGTMWQPNQIPIYSTPSGAGKSMAGVALTALRQMQGLSRSLRHMGLDVSNDGKHAINNKFPFEYEKIEIDDMTFEEFFEMAYETTRFKRRLDAEIFKLNCLISYYRKQRNQYKPQKAKFRGGKPVHGKFEGYPNEALQKQKRLAEQARIDKIIEGYKFQIENIEEDHPEWLI